MIFGIKPRPSPKDNMQWKDRRRNNGGGIAAVPLLKASGIPLKKAHATSLAVILPISLVSAILYMANGAIRFADAWPYLPGGFLGAILGALLMQKIPDKLLRKAFGAFMIYAAVRLLLR